ncbi:MAG: aminopeptidase P family protein [Myxococcales bacterium FL481]|nr:MAG: aminopeptidase P family protein [Myxococcales bacterium FL481]
MFTTRRDFLWWSTAVAAATAACRRQTAPPPVAVTAPPDDESAALRPGGAKTPSLEPDSAAPAFPELAGFCDGVPPIGDAELGSRVENARRQARDRGYDGVLLEAGVSMRYFTGVRLWLSERPVLLWIPVAGDVVWVPPAFEEGSLRERLPSGATVRGWQEHEGPYGHAAGLVRDTGARRGKVALDPVVRSFVSHGLAQASPGTVFDPAAGVVEACRMRKSPTELAIMRRANEATQASLRAAAGRLTEGMTQSEFRRIVRAAQTAAGLTDLWALVLFGPNAAFPHGTEQDRAATRGELILVDTGGELHGYQSDITRSWALGSVRDELRRAWETVRAAQDAALTKMRPGARCSEADAAARSVLAAAGYGADYERLTHRLGHGIGMQIHEHPYMVRGNDQVLAPGMTMSNEPGIYVPGSFGVRLEDIVAITEDGHEVFGRRAPSFEVPFG